MTFYGEFSDGPVFLKKSGLEASRKAKGDRLPTTFWSSRPFSDEFTLLRPEVFHQFGSFYAETMILSSVYSEPAEAIASFRLNSMASCKVMRRLSSNS